MIEPLRRSRVFPVKTPLPPDWIRVGPTAPDQPERIGPSLFRVGPKEVLRAALIESIDQAREVVAAIRNRRRLLRLLERWERLSEERLLDGQG